MIETLDKSELEIDKKEVLRYLGYGQAEADEKTLKRIENLTEELKKELSPKVCYDKYPVIRDDEDISFGVVKTNSKDLKKNLKGCDEVLIFVATIGVGVDRIIGKYANVSPLDAVICQAIGASLIEEVCDIFCAKLGDGLKPRYSPGYGDFPVENQKEIFGMLDVPRKIGVTLTESMQMVPTKSVSALVGIKK
ncbi:MAG: Vitamin B12 dependent methionine synthase activation subunit [Clostridia bacterium]|nr:Vitamin B12 dependent methionine synthase activation subunit [Clostridia bacterium]